MDKLSNSRTVIVIATAFVAIVAAVVSLGGEDKAGAALRDIPFTTSDGSTQTLADHEGEALVINYFASWCAPCRAELPDFEAVSKQVGDDVTFLGVNTDSTESTWRSFVAEAGVTYETVFDPGRKLFLATNSLGMPTTVFLSPDGEVLKTHTGVLNQKQLLEHIDTYLR